MSCSSPSGGMRLGFFLERSSLSYAQTARINLDFRLPRRFQERMPQIAWHERARATAATFKTWNSTSIARVVAPTSNSSRLFETLFLDKTALAVTYDVTLTRLDFVCYFVLEATFLPSYHCHLFPASSSVLLLPIGCHNSSPILYSRRTAETRGSSYEASQQERHHP